MSDSDVSSTGKSKPQVTVNLAMYGVNFGWSSLNWPKFTLWEALLADILQLKNLRRWVEKQLAEQNQMQPLFE